VFHNEKLKQEGLQECLDVIHKWNCYLTLAKIYQQQFQAFETPWMHLMKSFLPLEVENTIETFFSDGRLKEILFLRNKNIFAELPLSSPTTGVHLDGGDDELLGQLLKRIPEIVPIDLMRDIFLTQLEKERSSVLSVLSQRSQGEEEDDIYQQDNELMIQEAFLERVFIITQELFGRCRTQSLKKHSAVCENSSVYNPIEHSYQTCVSILNFYYSLSFGSLNKDSSEEQDNSVAQDLTQLIHEISQFQNYLKILLLSTQILKYPEFKFQCDLDDIISGGMKGLLFQVFDEFPLVQLKDFIAEKVDQFTGFFPDCDLDNLLKDWVESSIQQYLLDFNLIDGLGVDTSQNDMKISENTDLDYRNARNYEINQKKNKELPILLRIILVLCCVKDSAIQQTLLLLKFFQIPSLEMICNLEKETVVGAEQPQQGRKLTDLLLSLSNALLLKVDGSLNDSLLEAVRLFRMKCISLSYHIESFDVKDPYQLSYVVSIILNSKHISPATYLQDAIAFAMDGNTMRIDCRPSLIRIILHAIQEIDLSAETNNNSSSNNDTTDLKLLLKQIPKFLFMKIFDDLVFYCCDQVNELCGNNKIFLDSDYVIEETTEEALKLFLQRTCRGCIKLIEFVNDELLYGNAAAAASDYSTRTNRSSAKENTKYSQTLTEMKKISQLQSNFQVYLNLKNLNAVTDCKTLIEALAGEIVNKWKKATSSSINSVETDVLALFNDCLKLKKICSVLNHSSQVYVLFITKQLIGLGKKVRLLSLFCAFFSFSDCFHRCTPWNF
jgi:hypothetical protein